MKKAELEAHRRNYQEFMQRARTAEEQGLFRSAMDAALSSWDYIDGMMQYERKYEQKEFANIAAIDLILKYAPLLLDYRCLNKLEGLLRDHARIKRNTSDDIEESLASARARMWHNHRLWSYLESNPGARQDELRKTLGEDQDYWRSVAEAWEKMGLLGRVPEANSYRLALTTRMGQLVRGKCPSCGEVVEAPKGMFLEAIGCPSCATNELFVILISNAGPRH